jgi:glucokinase
MKKELALGIDIGGTSIEFGIVDREGNVLFEKDFPTKSFDSPTDFIEKVASVLKPLSYTNELVGIGIGAPNGNFFTGNIEFAPNLNWEGIIPLAHLFSERFNLPTFMTNDANAAAIGEMLFGNARDINDFVTITLGTGVGSGVIINNQLVYGHDGFAGEYGHIRIVPNGRSCGCGRRGCLETYCSSTGVVRSISELDSPNKSFSTLLSIDNPSAKDVFEAADEGDLFASEIVTFTAQTLASSLADFACFSSPKAYILFGGYAQHYGNFPSIVKKFMEEEILVIYKNKIDIRISALHDKNAAVLGAAAHLFSNLNTKNEA